MPRLSRKFAVAAGLSASVAAGGAGVGVRVYRAPAKTHCALPANDYQHSKYAQPILALSQTALLVPGRGPALVDSVGRRMKYFQLATNALVIDHCRITRFSLVLREDGVWWVSLRADQNFRPPDPIPQAPAIAPDAPLPPTTKQTLHIKRNQFLIAVHGFADYPLRTDVPEVRPGRPLLFDLLPDPFWVQNGQPLEFRSGGKILDFAGQFDAIERVELEFSYR